MKKYSDTAFIFWLLEQNISTLWFRYKIFLNPHVLSLSVCQSFNIRKNRTIITKFWYVVYNAYICFTCQRQLSYFAQVFVLQGNSKFCTSIHFIFHFYHSKEGGGGRKKIFSIIILQNFKADFAKSPK